MISLASQLYLKYEYLSFASLTSGFKQEQDALSKNSQVTPVAIRDRTFSLNSDSLVDEQFTMFENLWLIFAIVTDSARRLLPRTYELLEILSSKLQVSNNLIQLVIDAVLMSRPLRAAMLFLKTN